MVNYLPLADFRVEHQLLLDICCSSSAAVLSHQGLITLKRVMHDGTKIKASAADKAFGAKPPSKVILSGSGAGCSHGITLRSN